MAMKTFEQCGYPFILSFNRLQTPAVSVSCGIYRKDIYVWLPVIEIKIIKNWRPVAQPKSPIANFKEREKIVLTAKSRAGYLNYDLDNIPF